MLAKKLELSKIHERLTAWFATRMPRATGLALADLERPSSGLSNETLMVDLSWTEDGAPHAAQLVLRLEPADFCVFPDYDLSRQVRILGALANTPVPVPKVRWFEPDRSLLGVPFYLMDRV